MSSDMQLGLAVASAAAACRTLKVPDTLLHVATGRAGGSLKPLSRQATAIPVHRHLVRAHNFHA